MTFTIPVWLLWTAGVVIGVPVTLFALLGSLFSNCLFEGEMTELLICLPL